MAMEPPLWWLKLKLTLLRFSPGEPRRKIKKALRLGDDYRQKGKIDLAEYCYAFSKELAQQIGAVHLSKKIEERFQSPWF